MNAQSRRHHSVIVGVDPSDEARRALHWAAAEAQRRRWPMQIVHAVQTDDQGVAQKIVDTALADVRAAWPGVDVMGESVADDTATALARTATDRDILVVGSRGLGRIASVLVGSVSSAVARHATCPVVVVRDPNTLPRHPESTSGVILGVDGSEASISAAGFAFEAASLRGRPLTVVHAVWDPYTESQAVVAILSDPERVVVDDSELLDVAEAVAGWRELYPDVKVVTRYENGRPDRVLGELSDGADLLVVGARGRGPAATLLLGSVSRRVLQRASCPVAVVRRRPRERSR